MNRDVLKMDEFDQSLSYRNLQFRSIGLSIKEKVKKEYVLGGGRHISSTFSSNGQFKYQALKEDILLFEGIRVYKNDKEEKVVH